MTLPVRRRHPTACEGDEHAHDGDGIGGQRTQIVFRLLGLSDGGSEPSHRAAAGVPWAIPWGGRAGADRLGESTAVEASNEAATRYCFTF